jgi:hypothetical protein
VRLDDYIETNHVSRLDFVKVDVEGAERLVINGFLKGLARFQPILALEVSAAWSQDFGYLPTELLQEVRTLGYNQFDQVGKRGKLVPLKTFTHLNELRESIDVICSVAPSHDSRLLRLRSTGT